MKDIAYNKEILEVLKDLSDSLIKQFKINKIEDNLSIRVKENSLGIMVDFSTPVSNFDFEGIQIGFAENVYSEFYKFFDLFKNPSLTQDGNKLIMKENKQTIKFSPSNPEIIDNEFKSIKGLPESVVSFNLNVEQFSYIKKMIKMIGASVVNFSSKKDSQFLKINIENDVNKNDSSILIDLEEPTKEDVDIDLNTTIFKSGLPLKYVVNIIPKAKMFTFSSVNENFNLNLYTGFTSGV
jgi:hypothetical protein